MDHRVLVSCDFHLSCLRVFSHTSNLARVPNNCTFSVTFDTPSKHTKPTVTLFVLLLKYAHIRVIVTLLACRVMARVPVRSPLSLKSHGGSHMLRHNRKGRENEKNQIAGKLYTQFLIMFH